MPTVEQLQRLLEADPNDTFVLYGLAQAHAANGDHDAAIEAYDRCLATDRLYAYAYYHKARCEDAAGRRQAALETLATGLAAAREAGDQKAVGEIGLLIDELKA